jgi:hypothetical protein
MARSRKVNNMTLDPTFGGKSDIPFVEKPPQQDLAEGLFELLDPKKTVDAFEQAKGIIQKPVKTPVLIYKSIMLDMDKAPDRKLFDQMLNDKKYKIVSMDKNWTSLGRYRAFIVYTEEQVNDTN